jgi:cytochrome o ubiquinol oxidase subunit 1
MLWFIGFLIIFTIGGMDGVLMGVAPADFQLHNSLFLIAHFHSMVIGGVAFGLFAGFTYWFPKIFGFKLNDRLGEWAAFCWILGFLLAFIPLYILGLMGATRRLDHYDASTGWAPLFMVAAVGAGVITIGICFQVAQIWVSVKHRKKYRDTTGDPWNGRTLEWSTSSPPPVYNFAIIPEAKERDAFWAMKESNTKPGKPRYEAIHMPKNTPNGLYVAAFNFLFAFAAIWHIVWLSVVGLIGTIVGLLFHLYNKHNEYHISSEEVAEIEAKSRRL